VVDCLDGRGRERRLGCQAFEELARRHDGVSGRRGISRQGIAVSGRGRGDRILLCRRAGLSALPPLGQLCDDVEPELGFILAVVDLLGIVVLVVGLAERVRIVVTGPLAGGLDSGCPGISIQSLSRSGGRDALTGFRSTASPLSQCRASHCERLHLPDYGVKLEGGALSKVASVVEA
jgi:hypothetical protein